MNYNKEKRSEFAKSRPRINGHWLPKEPVVARPVPARGANGRFVSVATHSNPPELSIRQMDTLWPCSGDHEAMLRREREIKHGWVVIWIALSASAIIITYHLAVK